MNGRKDTNEVLIDVCTEIQPTSFKRQWILITALESVQRMQNFTKNNHSYDRRPAERVDNDRDEDRDFN